MSTHIPPDTDDSLIASTSSACDTGSTRTPAQSDSRRTRDGDAKRSQPDPDTPPAAADVATTPVDQAADGADVARAVDFLTLLGASSLGTAEAREERLLGREELENFERAGLTPAPSEAERDFDLRVASELDWRGQSFEAELRYRAALRADRPEKLLTPLALLLEAKGRPRHALPLYVHAAQAREPNALFRLATISHHLGETEWCRGFVELGSASLEPEQVETVATTLNRLHHDRTAPDLGALVSRSVLQGDSIDAGYALGTVLLTSGSVDLARLTLCTALGRGHSLAALSLLDQRAVRRPSTVQFARRVLARAWSDGFGPDVNGLRRDRPGLPRLRELGGTVAASLTGLTITATGAGVPAAAHDDVPAPTSGGTVSPPTGELTAPGVQRALVFTRVVMMLRGLRRLGHDPVSLEVIDRASTQLCRTIRVEVEHGRLADEGALIGAVWQASADKLDRAKRRRLQLPQAPPVAPANRVLAAGVAHRYGHGIGALTRPQRRALTLDLAGAARDQIGPAMGLGVERDVRELVNASTKRLQATQQGEQFDPALWGQVEAVLAEVAPDLKADLARLPELDTGRSPTTSERR